MFLEEALQHRFDLLRYDRAVIASAEETEVVVLDLDVPRGVFFVLRHCQPGPAKVFHKGKLISGFRESC